MSKLFARFLKDESGATAIEYGLIAALIGVGIIAAAGGLKDQIVGIFDYIGNELDSASS